MICKVKETIKRYKMLENTSSVAIGISGGADSVSLFDILLKLRAEFGFELTAVHVNHNLRGEEAMRDQRFVEDLCKKNSVELNVVSVDVSSLAKKMHIGIEECGRKVRYEAFESTGCDKIAVAHSLSDCIETTVFNLIRGSSLSGVTRIPPIRGKIIRPLINCTSQEIRRYCSENNLDYVVDSTNLHDDYSRNFIRERIVPQFSRLNENFAESFERFYDSVEIDENFLNLQAEQLFEKAAVNNGFSREILLSADESVLKRCLWLILNKNMKKQVEKKHIDLVESAIKKCSSVQLSKDLYISSNRDIISIHTALNLPATRWEAFEKNGEFSSPYKTYLIRTERFDKEKHLGENNICDASFLEPLLRMRSRKDGDRIMLLKRKVSKTLKKLFNEEKIPVSKRNELAVLESNGKLIWVESFGVNAPFAVTEKTEKVAIIKIKEG